MPRKILLIDDSTTQLEMLRLQISRAGFIVETAKDGAEGYQAVFEMAPDLVLSDIVMPNLNGYQLCRLLKNNPLSKNIPVVLLTVLDKKIDKFWGAKSGADKFISKTMAFSEIEKVLNKIIEQNPVGDEYKQALLETTISGNTIQNEINSVLDELLMNSTFLNEFRDLGEFFAHGQVLIEKTFELLGSFIDYNIAGLFFNSPDEKEQNTLFLDLNKNSVSTFVIEKVKREFFAQMPNIGDFNIRNFGHEIVRESVENSELILSADNFKAVHILPFVSSGALLGGICFYGREDCDYSDFKFYKTMISELLLLFKMRFLYLSTEHLSVTDGLTGLYNRRHFENNIEREFLRSRRYRSTLSLAIVDVDYFKKVNDNHGHQFGDYVLRELSSLMYAAFRKTDMIYRYGGEELAVILTETSLKSSFIPLERLREKIAQHKFIYNNEEINITVSIGIGSNRSGFKTQNELIECADKALYEAKASGRNKVIMHSDEEVDDVL